MTMREQFAKNALRFDGGQKPPRWTICPHIIYMTLFDGTMYNNFG